MIIRREPFRVNKFVNEHPICDYSEALGRTVELKTALDNQKNIIAYLNESRLIWFSAHLDTVPPFIPPTEADWKIC